MKKPRLMVLCVGVASLFALSSADATSVPGNAGETTVSSQVQELQEKIMGDPGILSLIQALQADPEMQALLSDPKFLAAAQAGDIGALLSDPRFMKLLDNPQIKEIGKRVESRKPEGQ